MLISDSGKVFFFVCLKVAYFSSRGKYLLLCVGLKNIDIKIRLTINQY